MNIEYVLGMTLTIVLSIMLYAVCSKTRLATETDRMRNPPQRAMGHCGGKWLRPGRNTTAGKKYSRPGHVR